MCHREEASRVFLEAGLVLLVLLLIAFAIFYFHYKMSVKMPNPSKEEIEESNYRHHQIYLNMLEQEKQYKKERIGNGN